MSRIANRLKQLEGAMSNSQERFVIIGKSIVAPNGDVTCKRLSAIFLGAKVPTMRRWPCETDDQFEARASDMGHRINSAGALPEKDWHTELGLLADEIKQANEMGAVQ